MLMDLVKMKVDAMKKPVSIYVLHSLLGRLLGMTDEQVKYLMTIDNHDPVLLLALIHRWVVPNYVEYDKESQACIKHSLEYFLARQDRALERILPSLQIQV